MKTTYRSILAVVALAIFTVSTATVRGQFDYVVTNATVTITRYTGPGGDVTIPSQINGLPVTIIGDWAFGLVSTLTNLTIPDTVTSIGGGAFLGCTSLTTITIPDSVISMESGEPISPGHGEGIFKGCTSLTNVTIGNSVTLIGDYAFEDCVALTRLTVGDSVTNILGSAFRRCSSLTTVTIPASVTSIGYGVFGGCDVFEGCTNLTAITVDPLNPYYSSLDGVLFDKNQTTLIEFPGGKAGNYTIPNNVTVIEWGAFVFCTGLSSVTIPDSVTSIGPVAFSSCTSLTNVSIGNSVISLGDHAFYYCSGLTSITIPTSVTSIGEGAFQECTSLTRITMGDAITTIGHGAFSSCTKLTGVYFQGNAPLIDSWAFVNTPNVTVYYLPGTIGWGDTYAERPTAPWLLPSPVILTTAPNFGIQTKQFGFRISWATDASVVVEGSATLVNPVWYPVSTNTLRSGWVDFSDAEWTNYPNRFYRVRQW